MILQVPKANSIDPLKQIWMVCRWLSQVTLPNNIGISTNDDMLAWILIHIANVLKMPNSQAAISFQDVSL